MQHERVQHEKLVTSKVWNREKVQHEKSATHQSYKIKE